MANQRILILNKYTPWLKDNTRSLIITGTIPYGLKCRICSKLIIEPWQCEGKRYCNSCLVANNLTFPDGCPDEFATKEILLLRCHCCYNNCPWEGLVHELEKHAKKCKYNEDGACSHEIVGCEAKGSKVQLQNHYQESTIVHSSLICTDIYFKMLSIIKLPSSIDEKFLAISKDIDKANATQDEFITRNRLVKDRFTIFKQNCSQYLSEPSENENKIAYVTTFYSVLMLQEEIQKLYKSLKSYFQNDKSSASESPDDACSHDIVGCEAEGPKDQIQNHYQESTRSNNLTFLEDIQKHNNSLKSCLQEVKAKKIKDEDKKLQIEKKLKLLKDFVDDNEKKVAKMENEVRIRNNISLHGYNIMRFDNMVDKLHGARLGNTKEFHSQPMWTDPFGYKFRIVILYLGEERHYINNVSQPCISIYFKLMKGENDDLLTFPFPYPIQISIRNQSGGKDKSRVLEPVAQESFERCFGDENTPVGFSMFIEHDELLQKGFVSRDGTMFVETSVLKDKIREDFRSCDKQYNDYHHYDITDEARIRIDQCMDSEHFYALNTYIKYSIQET